MMQHFNSRREKNAIKRLLLEYHQWQIIKGKFVIHDRACRVSAQNLEWMPLQPACVVHCGGESVQTQGKVWGGAVLRYACDRKRQDGKGKIQHAPDHIGQTLFSVFSA